MARERMSLDSWDETPRNMKMYLRENGFHFNKKLYEFAASKMYKQAKGSNAKEIMKPVEKEKVQELLKKYNVQLENYILYDSTYLYTMEMSDFFGKSLPNEQYVALWIKDMIDDVDKKDGYIFNRFYADMCFMGIPIDWEEVL